MILFAIIFIYPIQKTLSKFDSKLNFLEQEKLNAIRIEDYDLAKELKVVSTLFSVVFI